MKRCAIICLLGVAAWTAQGVNKLWTPNTDPEYPINNRWLNRDNWVPIGAPGINDVAVIKNAAANKSVILDGVAYCQYLEIAPDWGDVAWMHINGGAITNTWGDNVVGGSGEGHLVQTGGTFHSPQNFIIGNYPGSKGYYTISNGGTYSSTDWWTFIGNDGYGEVNIMDGKFIVSFDNRHSALGNLPNGHGRMNLNNGEFVAYNNNMGHLRVGNEGRGEVVMHGGRMHFRGDVYVGYTNKTHTSFIELLGGVYENGWNTHVGYFGKGLFVVASDATINGGLFVGEKAGSDGKVEARENGTLLLSNTGEGYSRQLFVGQDGAGELLMTGGLVESSVGSWLRVRHNAGATGLVNGHGTIKNFRNIINNGKVIADGFGEEKDLDLAYPEDPDYPWVAYNTIANDADNGWYARNGGRLLFPPRMLRFGREYVVGDTQGNDELDLVNSIRISLNPGPNLGGWDYLNVTLLAPDRSEVPQLPVDDVVAGLWKITFKSDNNLGPIDVEMRFDSVAIKNQIPVVYVCDPLTSKWTKLAVEDLGDHRVKVSGIPLYSMGGNAYSAGFIANIKPPQSTLFFLK